MPDATNDALNEPMRHCPACGAELQVTTDEGADQPYTALLCPANDWEWEGDFQHPTYGEHLLAGKGRTFAARFFPHVQVRDPNILEPR